MKTLIILFTIIPIILQAQESEVTGKYTFTLRPHPSSVYRVYNLTLNPNHTFKLSKYYEEFCYNHTDSVTGKWIMKDSIIIFPKIDYQNRIESKQLDSISNNQIVIVHKDILQKEITRHEVYITALDSNFNLIKIFYPFKTMVEIDETKYLQFIKQHNMPIILGDPFREAYLERHLISYIEIPTETTMLIYHGKLYNEPIIDISLEDGININIQNGDNHFTVFDKPYILNSSIKFERTHQGTLRSLKPVDSEIGKKEKHEYKKI